MALVSKSTKTGGTTSLQDGQIAVAADVQTDSDTLFNLVNGNIDNDNIKASAGIEYSKLSLANSITSADIAAGAIVNSDVNAAAAIAPTKIDDSSTNDAAHDDITDPGVSNSFSNPTTLDGELQQLRFVAQRLALGNLTADALGVRYDATGTGESVYWGDLPARGMTRIQGFNGVTTSGLPSGWTNVGTATLAQEAADAADGLAGKGRAIKITAAGSANEGISYPLSGLKESTRYFVAALVKATSGDTVKMTTTGADAASSFRDITATSTSTTWTWLSGVIQTDSTPTNIVISILAAADTDIVWVADVQYGECSVVPSAQKVAVVEQLVASAAGTAITGSTTDGGLDTNYQFIDDSSTDLDATVYVPGDGYYIRVMVDVNAAEAATGAGSAQVFKVRLYQSVNGAALSAVRTQDMWVEHDSNEQGFFTCAFNWIVKNPNPGQSYRYAVAATRSGGTENVVPQLGSTGSSSLTIEVLPYSG